MTFQEYRETQGPYYYMPNDKLRKIGTPDALAALRARMEYGQELARNYTKTPNGNNQNQDAAHECEQGADRRPPG